ncbi:hypothetical protein SDJN02_25948, partial [Cucurbita argyrosperma subsp. argyrosperma]
MELYSLALDWKRSEEHDPLKIAPLRSRMPFQPHCGHKACIYSTYGHCQAVQHLSALFRYDSYSLINQ